MKKLYAVFVIFTIILLYTGSTVFADDTEIKNRISSAEQRVSNIENEITALENEKKNKSAEIVKADAELRQLSQSIEGLETQIADTTAQLDEAIRAEQESYDTFANRLRIMYEQGNNSYIKLLLGSEDVGDLIERVEIIKEISSYDSEVYSGYKETRETIEKQGNELSSRKQELVARSEEFNGIISQKNAELEAIVDQIALKNSEKNAAEEEITELNKSLSSMDYADKLFAEAEKYLGMPYVFGGSTPETSFDCSGFVCYATTHSGVCDLPRTTAQGIYNQCIKISESEAKRGDIIFFQGTYNAGETVTHVGFYAGDGKMLHCGDPIQYTSTQTDYWRSHFYAFGRLNI